MLYSTLVSLKNCVIDTAHYFDITEAAVGETVDPCCASQAIAPTKETSSRVEEPIDEK